MTITTLQVPIKVKNTMYKKLKRMLNLLHKLLLQVTHSNLLHLEGLSSQRQIKQLKQSKQSPKRNPKQLPWFLQHPQRHQLNRHNRLKHLKHLKHLIQLSQLLLLHPSNQLFVDTKTIRSLKTSFSQLIRRRLVCKETSKEVRQMTIAGVIPKKRIQRMRLLIEQVQHNLPISCLEVCLVNQPVMLHLPNQLHKNHRKMKRALVLRILVDMNLQ